MDRDWEQSYRRADAPWDTGRPSAELMAVLREEAIPPGRAIDLGCGTGANAVALAERRFEVTGVDVSELALQRARRRAAEAGVRARFIRADLLEQPELGGPFDFLFDRGCYHVLRRENVWAALQMLRSLTRPGSRFLLLTGNADGEWTEHGPPRVHEAELREELGELFEIEWIRPFRFDARPGEPHYLGHSCLMHRPHEREDRTELDHAL